MWTNGSCVSIINSGLSKSMLFLHNDRKDPMHFAHCKQANSISSGLWIDAYIRILPQYTKYYYNFNRKSHEFQKSVEKFQFELIKNQANMNSRKYIVWAVDSNKFVNYLFQLIALYDLLQDLLCARRRFQAAYLCVCACFVASFKS